MADFVVVPMIPKVANNTHNTLVMMGVRNLISSKKFGYGEREKVEKNG